MTKHKSGKHEPDRPHPPHTPSAAVPSAAPSLEAVAESAAAAAASAQAEVATAKTEVGVPAVVELQAEIAALKDRELRARAELENFRKRAARELSESIRYANLPIMRDLLPVLDNVERAIQAAEQNAETNGLLEGVKLVGQQLEDVLKRYHCVRIEALHTPFDPNLHHAIMQQPSDEYPANTVLMVTQNGYQLHDRVVRPSQVIVSTSQQQES